MQEARMALQVWFQCQRSCGVPIQWDSNHGRWDSIAQQFLIVRKQWIVL